MFKVTLTTDEETPILISLENLTIVDPDNTIAEELEDNNITHH